MKKESVSMLIVEDDAGIRVTLTKILVREGYKVYTAETGSEAVQKLEKGAFNLALIDVRLPDMDGVALLAKMQKVAPKMMRIIVTGYPSLENAVKALNLGADAYVIKPIDPEKLLKLIDEKLREQSQAEKMTEEKVTEWIKARAKRLEDSL